MEVNYPIVIGATRCPRFRRCGAGHRGGLASICGEARSPFNFNSRPTRHLRAWGLRAGAGRGNRIGLRVNGEHGPEFANAKLFWKRIETGDAFIVNSGGGGGFGSPLERPAGKVRDDVRQGYVSPEAARALYGVVIDPETLELDIQATERVRAAMATLERAGGEA